MIEQLNDKPISNVFLISLSGLSKQLKSQVFPDKDIPVVIVQGDHHFRALFKQTKKIKYPFFSIILGGLEKNYAGYNPSILMRRGVRIAQKIENDSSTDYICHLIPININLTIRFVTNNIDDIYRFNQRWQILSTRKILNFKLNVEDTDSFIDVKVNLEETINFPNLDMEEIGEIMMTDTNTVLSTYTGVINKRVVVVKAETNVNLVNSQGIHTTTLNNFGDN